MIEADLIEKTVKAAWDGYAGHQWEDRVALFKHTMKHLGIDEKEWSKYTIKGVAL